MRTFGLLLLGASLLISSIASANEYEHYGIACRLSGTQQTISGNQQKLPFELTLKVDFATIVGQTSALSTKVRLESSRNFDVRDFAAALPVTASGVYRENCKGREANFTLGDMTADQFKRLLELLGAQNVPDLAETMSAGKAAIGQTRLGTHCSNYYYEERGSDRLSFDGTGPTLQLHFAPEKWDGLSYHLTIDRCKAIYIESNGSKHRLGH